jgi:ABC-type multidrug transport system ATPase subunit
MMLGLGLLVFTAVQDCHFMSPSLAVEGTVALRASDLSVSYEGASDVVRDVTVAVRPGDFIALLGANGSGKTTLLRAFAGLLSYQRGVIGVFDHDPDTPEARSRLTFVGDTPIFYEGVTIRENLEFVGRLHGVTGLSESSIVGELGVARLLDILPARLSRGQRQRAALAIGLARPWSLALLDEPLLGLDTTSSRRILDYLGRACRAGKAAVVATHDAEIRAAASAVCVVTDGELSWPEGSVGQTGQ